MNKKLITKLCLTFVACSTLLFSCYSPNPLYGKWADNKGNQITFNPDLTFNATIYDNSLNKNLYDGSFNIIENVMTISKSDGTTSNTEWDVRGSILYLTWTTKDGQTVNLQLYHISK